MTHDIFGKMFGHRKSTPREELEHRLEAFKKPEERKQPVPVIPPALKNAGKAAFQRFKEASVRMYEEEQKHKPKGASKGIFEAFKEASIRAYENQGVPMSGVGMPPMQAPKQPHKPRRTGQVGAYRYKKQRR